MNDSNENLKEQEQEIQKLKERLNQYELETVCGNPQLLNKYLMEMLTQIMIETQKLKEGLNQVLDALEELFNKKQSEPAQIREPVKKIPALDNWKRVAQNVKEDMEALP